ncbi:CoxG family protein [Bacillus sp. Marseille-P3661]|uniref:CoxG family protein n=1 Tax=Bacillus sp. Marseille-P3661 TaxID=1936234 RepID=UPI000C834E60|nr:SRPBCC family protein [Bacillus sp. Marseille-P3661]
MPIAKEHGRVNQNIHTMWDFIKDMENWAPCMPGYVSFKEVDKNVSIWCLKGDVGIFKRKVDFTVTVTERVAPDRIAFTLEAKTEGIKGVGSYKAVAVGDDATDVEFNLDMSGQGLAAKVVNVLLSKTLPRDCKILKDNLTKVLESEESPVEIR